MAAASQTLHDDLDVHLVNGTGADIDPSIVFCKDKGRLDSVDVQKFIGCLGPYDGRAFNVKPVPVAMAKRSR